MLWFIMAVTGYLFSSVSFILDKVVVSKSAVKPTVYAFYSCILMFLGFLVLPFLDQKFFDIVGLWWAILSGITFGLGVWTFFVAIKKGEASHIVPFNGAVITIFIYFLSASFLGEQLGNLQQFGVVILILSSLLLSYEKTKSPKSVIFGFMWAIISAVFFAVSAVILKDLYNHYSFWTALVWSRSSAGLIGLLLLLSPAVWRSFKKKKEKKKTYARRHAGIIIFSNKILSVFSIVILQYAIAIGSVTLVTAMAGVEYVLMFVLIYSFTKIMPKIFKEYFTEKELALEVTAIILVAVGSAMLVF